MNVFKNLVISGFAVASLLIPVAIADKASAATSNTTGSTCVVGASQPKIGTPIKDRKFTKIGNKVYINVVVTGKNCSEAVTLAAWKAPNGDLGKPYSEQKLFKYVTKTFGAGTHLMSIELPNCFYQVDLVRGAKPTGINGGGAYEKGRMIGSIHGGTKKCETTPPTTPPVTPPVTPELPKEIPNTGAGSIAGIFAGTATVGTLVHYVIRRKFLGL